jgi:hypothetical protein
MDPGSSIVRRLPVLQGNEESVLEFEVETRRVGTPASVAMSGYVKIKKLNSGG